MSFKAQQILDAVAMTNPDELGEILTYHPHNQTEKSIRARVTRTAIQIVGHGGRSMPGTVFELIVSKDPTVRNDGTSGLTEIKERFDRVQIPLRLGADPVTCVVSKVLDEWPGGWHLEATV